MRKDRVNRGVFPLLVGVFLLFLDRIFWSSSPAIASLANNDLKTGVSYFLDIATGSGLPLVLLSLGFIFASQSNSVTQMVKIWFNTILSGLMVLLFLLLFNREFYRTMLIDTLFPILRNSQTEITALLFILLLNPIIQQVAKKLNRRTFFILLVCLFGIGTVFNKDIFLLNEGSGLNYALVMAGLGAVLYAKSVRLTWPKAIAYTLVAGC